MSFKEKDPMPAGHMRLPAAVSMVIERFSKTKKYCAANTYNTHGNKEHKDQEGRYWNVLGTAWLPHDP